MESKPEDIDLDVIDEVVQANVVDDDDDDINDVSIESAHIGKYLPLCLCFHIQYV